MFVGFLGFLRFSRFSCTHSAHAVRWTQEYDQEEGLREEINSCTATLNVTNNSNSNVFK